MTRPLIGITTYGRDEKNQFLLPAEYVEAIRRAGGVPLLLPPGEADFDRVLATVDAVLFSGGGDLSPELWGGEPHETLYMVDEERDRTELELAKRTLATRAPTLAICRGTQILNVALGGTLWVHLPDVVGEKVLHRRPPREPIPHEHTVEESSGLARILEIERFSAASWHHQAIRDPAPGLRVVAHAPDGVIEAVEMPEHPWLFAVQWHPELTAAADPAQQRLFDALVHAARATKRP